MVAVKKAIDRDMGATDILVNNAGLMPKMSLREGKPDDIERVINVNVTSHFWVRLRSAHIQRNTVSSFIHFFLNCIHFRWFAYSSKI